MLSQPWLGRARDGLDILSGRGSLETLRERGGGRMSQRVTEMG